MFITDDDGGFSTLEMLIIFGIIYLIIWLKKKIEIFIIKNRTKRRVCLLCKSKIPEGYYHYWYRSPNMKIPDKLKSESKLKLLGIKEFYLCEACVEIVNYSINPKDS